MSIPEGISGSGLEQGRLIVPGQDFSDKFGVILVDLQHFGGKSFPVYSAADSLECLFAFMSNRQQTVIILFNKTELPDIVDNQISQLWQNSHILFYKFSLRRIILHGKDQPESTHFSFGKRITT